MGGGRAGVRRMYKVVVFGAGGFIGSHVAQELAASGHEVVGTRRSGDDSAMPSVDLMDGQAVGQFLEDARPDIIINCAGIVRNDQSAEANVGFSRNILSQVIDKGLQPRRIVVLGSAAEYGVVEPGDVPVNEDTPLQATAPYGRSKVEEVEVAMRYREDQALPVVVGRVFNPIGSAMPERLLVPRMLGQIEEYRQGRRQALEISRLDAERDYLDVRDLARALAVLALGEPRRAVYNLGSGVATSSGRLLELLVQYSQLSQPPQIIETAPEPEPLYAPQADISRLRAEFGWQAAHDLNTTIKEIVDAANQQS